MDMNMLYNLRCLGYVEIDDNIWFSNLYFNALIKLDKLTGQIEIIDKFPNYEIDQVWLYSTVCHINNLLVFVPFRSTEIVVYNIKTEKFISVALDLTKVGKRERYFASAYIYGNYIYMFPVEAKCIIRYDVQLNSIKYLENGLIDVRSTLPKTTECFALQFEIIGKKIYIPFAELNAIAIFNLEKETIDIQYLNITGGCSTINYFEGYFYMASWKQCKIYRWNNETEEIIEYVDFPKEFTSGDYMFSSACSMKDRIFFLPIQGNMIISFEIKSKKLYEEKRISNLNYEEWNTFFCEKGSDKVIIWIAGEENLFVLDYSEEKLQIKPYFQQKSVCNKRYICDFFIEYGCFNVIFENEKDLYQYIEVISNSSEIQKKEKTREYGKIIWNSESNKCR